MSCLRKRGTEVRGYLEGSIPLSLAFIFLFFYFFKLLWFFFLSLAFKMLKTVSTVEREGKIFSGLSHLFCFSVIHS